MSFSIHSLVFGSISVIVSIYLQKYEDSDKAQFLPDKPHDFLLPQIQEFDFIVVGGGSAGSVVVNQLSKKFSVLLLEAGGDPIPPLYVPANVLPMIQDSNPSAYHIWKSEKQSNAHRIANGEINIHQGKFLGGSSAANVMMYNRGHPKDYDNWAKIIGDDSWSYNSLVYYFKKSEGFYDEGEYTAAAKHLGINGPLSIGIGGYTGLESIFNAFVSGGSELGYLAFNNSNFPHQVEGVGPIHSSKLRGRRVSAYDAFIQPILHRETLTILRYSMVSKVDIDGSGRAVGVYYTRHGVAQYAVAKKEIILSAGALNSPMILMRSGIGPREQLNTAGIPVRVNLPVGQNLQDHPWSGVSARVMRLSKADAILGDLNSRDIAKYLEDGKGPLSLAWGAIGQGFIVSSMSKAEGTHDWPDIQLLLVTSHQAVTTPLGDDNRVQLVGILTRPSSIGSLTLNHSNQLGPGIWNPGYLSDTRDVSVLSEAARISSEFLETDPFAELGLVLDKTVMPGCGEEVYGYGEYWKCHVQQLTQTTYHPVGTCRMGHSSDPTAVVDSQLKVKGIRGLRVVDNSIQPVIINSNTNAPALMIGQKGSALILSSYM